MTAYYKLSDEDNANFTIIDSEFSSLINRIYQSNMVLNVDKIKRAYEIAKFYHRDTKRKSGELYLYHPLAVLEKLFNDGFVDPDILAAAMLHDTVEDTEYTLDDVQRDFGYDVREYVHAVTKFEASKDPLTGNTKKASQEQTDEHMLELGQKYRLALYIKLADRWHNLHTCQKMSPESIRRNIAHTKSVLIPLARKIGCNVMADELLDACLYAKHQDEHDNIKAQQLDYIKYSRKGIEKTISIIKGVAQNKADVDSQFTTPFPFMVKADICEKFPNANLRRPDLFSFYEYKPYVLIFFKIHNPSEKSLRIQFLEICKSLIQDDAITITDEPDNKDVESANIAYVDITDSSYYNRIRVVVLANEDFYRYRNPLSAQCNIPRSPEALNPEKRITVYSKDGHPIDIERGATVLDFAFILNSEIGAHYQSAEVNGKPVDIDYVLQPNDTILIHKNDTSTARIEWFRILETKTAINRLINNFSTSTK